MKVPAGEACSLGVVKCPTGEAYTCRKFQRWRPADVEHTSEGNLQPTSGENDGKNPINGCLQTVKVPAWEACLGQ